MGKVLTLGTVANSKSLKYYLEPAQSRQNKTAYLALTPQKSQACQLVVHQQLSHPNFSHPHLRHRQLTELQFSFLLSYFLPNARLEESQNSQDMDIHYLWWKNKAQEVLSEKTNLAMVAYAWKQDPCLKIKIRPGIVAHSRDRWICELKASQEYTVRPCLKKKLAGYGEHVPFSTA